MTARTRGWLARAAGLLSMAVITVGCGSLTRDNPLDPRVGGGASLREELIGSWSRDEPGDNEVYTFKVDGAVELRSFTNPAGGPVDRNQPFPTTRVRVFEGTYRLVGDTLSLFFTRAQSNDPDDDVQPPAGEVVVAVAIQRNTLTMTLVDGKVFYTRLN